MTGSVRLASQNGEGPPQAASRIRHTVDVLTLNDHKRLRFQLYQRTIIKRGFCRQMRSQSPGPSTIAQLL